MNNTPIGDQSTDVFIFQELDASWKRKERKTCARCSLMEGRERYLLRNSQEIEVRIKTRPHNNILSNTRKRIRQSKQYKPKWEQYKDYDKNIKMEDNHETVWRTLDAIIVYPERNLSRRRRDRKSGNTRWRFWESNEVDEDTWQIPYGRRIYFLDFEEEEDKDDF